MQRFRGQVLYLFFNHLLYLTLDKEIRAESVTPVGWYAVGKS